LTLNSRAHVFANGKSYTNAVVLPILESATEITFIKAQSFRELPQKLPVTKANEFTGEVYEFSVKPAAAYAEALRRSV
jgi:hypothetical protein